MPVLEQVGVAADRGGQARERGGHRFEERVTHPLGDARQHEGVGQGGPRGRRPPRKWTRSATPSVRARSASRSRSGPWPTRISEASVRWVTAGQAEEDPEVLLGMNPAREDHTWARREAGLRPRRAGVKVAGVDPAGHRTIRPGRRQGPAIAARCRRRSPRRPGCVGLHGGGAGSLGRQPSASP